MEYFEVKDRLENLTEFRERYTEYIGFTNRENNLPAKMVMEKLEPMAVLTVDSLRRVGLGRMITKDAPNRGGRQKQINIIKAIFRPHIIRAFNLEDREPLGVLDAGIVEYKRMLWRQKLQIFNPIFWLYHFFGFLAKIPILIFRKVGYETSHAETLTSVRLYMIIFQFVCFYLVAAWSGLLGWIWIDILAL